MVLGSRGGCCPCLGTLPHPQLGHKPLPFPLPPSPPCLLPGCFLLTPGQAPKAGRVLVRTLRDTPACPLPGRAPVQQQHNVFSLGPSSCAGASPSLGIGEQRRRGGQAAGVGKESLKERLGWTKGRDWEGATWGGGEKGKWANSRPWESSCKAPRRRGMGGEEASAQGPQRYAVLHWDPAGTWLTNAMCPCREVQSCSRMAVLRSAGNNHASPCQFLASFFTSFLLPEKQTVNLQDHLAQWCLSLCVQSRMESVASRTLTSLLCFCSSIELFLSQWWSLPAFQRSQENLSVLFTLHPMMKTLKFIGLCSSSWRRRLRWPTGLCLGPAMRWTSWESSSSQQR